MTREATPFARRLGRRQDEALFRRHRGRHVETGCAMQLFVGYREQTGFLASYSHGRRALPLAKNRLHQMAISIILLVFSQLNGCTGRSCVS
jgi:hypothetical protein